MKKLLTLVVCLWATNSLLAQVPNYSFENWDTDSVYAPTAWTTIGNVTKVNGSINVAARIENNIISETPGVIASGKGTLANLFQDGGVPYNQRPAKVRITCKYDLQDDDSAELFVSFRGNAFGQRVPFSFDTYRIGGSSSGYTTHTFDLELFVPILSPDTVTIAVLSSGIFATTVSESYIEVERIEFLDASNNVIAAPANHDFLNWESSPVYSPTGWITSDILIRDFFGLTNTNLAERITAAYEGSYAIKLTNFDLQGDIVPGAIMPYNPDNMDLDEDLPSFSIPGKVKSVSAQVKYSPQGGDSALIIVKIFEQGSIVGGARVAIGDSLKNYTLISANIEYLQGYSGIPDSANMIISSGNIDADNIQPNSVMIVDNVALSFYATGLHSISNSSIKLTCYPNPSSTSVTAGINIGNTTQLTIALLDCNGKMVYKETFEAKVGFNQFKIPTANLASGIYILEVSGASTHAIHKIYKN